MANGIDSGVHNYFEQNPIYGPLSTPGGGGASSGFGGFGKYGAPIAAGIGGLLGGMFGGDDDDSNMSQSIEDANRQYQQYLHEGLGALQREEKLGRGDISQYYQQGLGFEQPYSEAGQKALAQYQDTLGLGGPGAAQRASSAFKSSPGYQYALQQGLQSVQRVEAARGLRGSGAEERALQQTGQGMAAQDFGKYQQRLAGLAGMGQQVAGQEFQGALGTGRSLGQMGEYYGGQQAGLYGQMGQAQAESTMASAKAQQEAKAREQQQQSQLWGSLGSLAVGALLL